MHRTTAWNRTNSDVRSNKNFGTPGGPGRVGLVSSMCLVVALAMGGCPSSPTVNQPPEAQGVSASVESDGSASVALSAADSEGDAVTLVVLTLPGNGSLADANGAAVAAVPYDLPGGATSVVYTPSPGFVGDDFFTYAGRDAGGQGAAATVSLSVTAITPDVTFSADQTLDTLTVAAGSAALVTGNAVLTVTGDATIDGTLYATDGRVRLNVTGNLIVNGVIRSISTTGEIDDDAPINEQPSGVILVVGDGSVTLGSAAVLSSNGPILITDDAGQDDRTPSDFFAEVENVAGDELSTLVPLPPDDPVFAPSGPGKIKVSPQQQDGALPPIVIGGTWPPVGAAPPRGDRPVVIFRFNGPRDLNLDGWNFNGPPAPAGESVDGTSDEEPDATGARGKNGLRLNIWNNGGAIRIVNNVSINLPDGGDGGAATTACATAIGGPGGDSGNFRMTAVGGIDISNGTLTINPGRGGNGGDATVNPAEAGAEGCPGESGRSAVATGGKGGDNLKRLFVRGNVAGLENVSIGAIVGGDGGSATALACDGGAGFPCCDGGAGGDALATGGAGGSASISTAGLAIPTGAVIGGDGGEATALGGNGDEGGDCKLTDGGDGGAGGSAAATGGAGGSATNSGGGGATGGDGGDADATGGFGDDGGDSGLGEPGAGGLAGVGVALAGTGGAGSNSGAEGTPTEDDGLPGLDGDPFDVVVYCFELGFLADGSGGIFPGVYEGVVTDPDTNEQLGSLAVEFIESGTAGYLSELAPFPHIGIADGQMVINFSTLSLEVPPPGAITGIRLEPLYATNVNELRPIRVEAINEDGVVLDTRLLTTIPDNQVDPSDPTPIDAEFELDVPIAGFRIVAPGGTFITLFRFYLVDP